MKFDIKLFFKGFLIGVANAIPGISGGTIAYILKVYDFLLNGLALNFNYIFKNFFKYLLFGVGLLLGVFGFSLFLDSLIYSTFPLILNLSFIGLILGSLDFIFKQTKIKLNSINIKDVGLILAGIVLVILPVLLTEIENTIIVTPTLLDSIGLLFAGILGAFAMIIPGISGSFLMLALGYYQTIIVAIVEFNLAVEIPVILGVLIGLVGGARLVKYLLNNFSNPLYRLILGFVIGSIFTINVEGLGLNLQTLIGTVLLILFAYLGYTFSQTKSA